MLWSSSFSLYKSLPQLYQKFFLWDRPSLGEVQKRRLFRPKPSVFVYISAILAVSHSVIKVR